MIPFQRVTLAAFASAPAVLSVAEAHSPLSLAFVPLIPPSNLAPAGRVARDLTASPLPLPSREKIRKKSLPSTYHLSTARTNFLALLLQEVSTNVIDNSNDEEWDLKVAIVGAGPSGLLLAHRLIKSSLPLSQIDIFEKRSDPRVWNQQQREGLGKGRLGGRAYALGLGIRGRSAIRTVDETLWDAVKKEGFECERFRLHFNSKFSVKLRDGDGGDNDEKLEPSVLIYQTDLCSALLDELERRASESFKGKLSLNFDSDVKEINLISSIISLDETPMESAHNIQNGPYDLIVGCDGANSLVRQSMQQYSPPDTFSSVQKQLLPSCFKVSRVDKMPPLMDGESVALLLPEGKNSGGVTAFVEPTVGGGGCILFAGKLPSKLDKTSSDSQTIVPKEGAEIQSDGVTDETKLSLSSLLFSNVTIDSMDVKGAEQKIKLVEQSIIESFPLLEGTPGMDDVALQLLSQRANVASSVKCNAYHSAATTFMTGDDLGGKNISVEVTPTVLCGDAAHATGGVSGQGCNSALVDAAVLADCLIDSYCPAGEETTISNTKKNMIRQSLLTYSMKQVPEGKALYDLSFGNDGKSLPIFRNINSIVSNAVDSVFRGRWGIGKKPLQTLLTSSLAPFADIRRERQKYYVENFPSKEEFNDELERLYS